MYKIDTSSLFPGDHMPPTAPMRTASMRIKGEGLGQVMTPGPVARLMISLVEADRAAPALEPGCGQGAFLQALKEAGFSNVNALDLDPVMVKTCTAQGYHVEHCNFLTWKVPEGGYQLIVGNPPYVRRKDMRPETRAELQQVGGDLLNGLADLLYAFIFRSVEMLRPGGELIFITPFYWLQSKHAGALRRWMLEQGHFSHILDLGENGVFPDANVHTAIWRYVKSGRGSFTRVIRVPSQRLPMTSVLDILRRQLDAPLSVSGPVLDFETRLPLGKDEIRLEPSPIAAILDSIPKSCQSSFAVEIREKSGKTRRVSIQEIQPANGDERAATKPLRLDDRPYEWRNRKLDEGNSGPRTVVLQDLFDNGPGMVSGLDAAFKVNAAEVDAFTALERQLIIQVVKGPDIAPGQITTSTPYLRADHLSESELLANYPGVAAHFERFRSQLEKRFDYGVGWFHWSFLRNERLFLENPGFKVFVPSKDRTARPRFGYTEAPLFGTQDTTVLIPRRHTLQMREDPRFFVAYLNSFVVDLWTQWRGIHRGAVRQYSHESLAWIPMPTIDWESIRQVKLYEELLAGLPLAGPWAQPVLDHIDSIFGRLLGVDPARLTPQDFPLTYEVGEEEPELAASR